ncbi:short-chain fatty acid transporter [Corynebacterium riegelii]|uniref:Serine--pyruvate aminotransferase n=2 Tax=Corynebacteriaceae TaxID=1653 RepID=A0A0K1RCD9_9CORY|nr:TIGR00366 family protein [Corynebacterium riegelii]AKV58851.1 serine--pyruvate aminotransferase [Corynebacterium riegelii]OFT75339.1 serine--pyruvate aminotransferase [Corynebacterium sp. HMSC30G07]
MNALANVTSRVVQRYLPDAFVLAILLTFLVVLAALGLTDSTPVDVVNYWGEGFSKLFVFGMQMALVLLTGFVLALSPVVEKMLDKLTDIPNTPNQAYALTAVISFICCYLNWGLGLVVGALVAREMGKKVKGLHFPLVVAAAYSAEIVRGPSSSIPVVMATPDHFMYEEFGIIPVTETLYSWWNIVVTLLIFAAIVAFYAFIKVPQAQVVGFVETVDEKALEVDEPDKSEMSFAERLDNSRVLLILLALLPLAYLVLHFADNGFDINLNTVILLFLTLALFAHRSVNHFLAAVQEAITSTRGIILQFPIYAGVAGIMSNSGLVEVFSNAFIGIANSATFPVITFLVAGLVNIFIPSGGGQWAIQGPVMLEAAQAIGADIPQTIMAFAWGDSWTNQIQPFWALPLLGVAGLNARSIMGYCLVWLFITGVIIAATFTLLAVL